MTPSRTAQVVAFMARDGGVFFAFEFASTHDDGSSDVVMPARMIWQDEPGYEPARRATMWNARMPHRFPEVIAQASAVGDVVEAVKLARRERLLISVCSGGHSWSGSHVRDGGLLLDLSRLNDVTIDKEALRATTGPGRLHHELAATLSRRGLFFPTGHCRGVGLGGYLLQGGFGWHSRVLGPACMSVLGLDVVTADGDIVYASEAENEDLYWAARGAGPGFFGVVTRFHLRVYPKPKVMGCALYAFPISALEWLFRWVHVIGPEIPPTVEVNVIMRKKAIGVGGPGIEIFAPVFENSLPAAVSALDVLTKSSLRDKTAWHVPFVPVSLGGMSRIVMSHYPHGHRWAVDNMWTHAPIDDLIPGLRKIAETMPPPPSHMTPVSRRGRRPGWVRCSIWRAAANWRTRTWSGAGFRFLPTGTSSASTRFARGVIRRDSFRPGWDAPDSPIASNLSRGSGVTQ